MCSTKYIQAAICFSFPWGRHLQIRETSETCRFSPLCFTNKKNTFLLSALAVHPALVQVQHFFTALPGNFESKFENISTYVFPTPVE